MISSNSRYADNPVLAIPYRDSTRLTIIEGAPAVKTFNFTYHQVSVLDSVDGLAHSYYGDGTQWWRIADANPEILDWFDLPIGAVLRIPSA